MVNAVDSKVPTPRPAPASRGSVQPGWARLFGYDIFLSFALGVAPRGARAYASDLARRLRERGFTVFFSEDEAPAGGELDRTLKRALGASRVLVVVANRGTLREPRWVRTEVEEFRRRHPKRAIVPISIDGALQDPELGVATESWLPFAQRIWIDETRQAGDAGSVSDAVIDRLVTAPHAVRSATRLRATVGMVITFLALLAAVAWWQKRAADASAFEAQSQRRNAVAQAVRADEAARQARAAASAAEAARREEQAARIAERRQRELAEERLRLAQSRELAVSANAALASAGPELAVLLAAAGVGLAPTAESQSALRAALLEPWGRRVVTRGLGPVWHAQYSADGTQLVAVGDDGAVVTDLATGAATRALQGQRLRTLDLGAGGGFAVSADEAGHAHLWHPNRNPAAPRAVEPPPRQRRLVLSADGRLAVTFGDGACAQLWAVASGGSVSALCGHPGPVRSVAFSPSGAVLLSSSDDGMVRVWDTATGRVTHTLKAPAARTRLVFSPDGGLAAAISTTTSNVQLWNARTWTAGATVGPDFSMQDAVFSPDGGRLVVTDALGFRASVFSTRDGAVLTPLTGHTGRIFSAAFSPDGSLLVTASEDKTARVWESGRGHAVAALRGHGDVVTSARFSPDGRHIATSSLDGTARIWSSLKFADVTDLNRNGPRIVQSNLDAGEREAWFVDSQHQATVLSLADQALRPLGRVPRDLMNLALGRDGRVFVTSETDGTLRLRRVADGDTQAVWPRVHTSGARLAMSPDGQHLLSTGGSAVLWDLQRHAMVATLAVRSPPSGAVFSPDGRYLLTLEGDAAVLRERHRGTPVATLGGRKGYQVTSARFSPDGRTIVTTSVDKTVRLWRTAAAAQPRELIGHTDAVIGAWFSADGQSIVSVGQDRTARVWDLATGQTLAELRGNHDNWAAASFHPGGALVLTRGGHNPATLWDARTGARLLEFQGGAAAFTPDGRQIVVVADGRVRLYRCTECGDARQLQGLAKARAERVLSADERRIYLHEAPKAAATNTQAKPP